MGGFGWLVSGVVLGAVLYVGLGHLADVSEAKKRLGKWAGLVSATLGLMVWLSVLYVKHTAWFFVPILLFGAVLILLGFISENFEVAAKKKFRLLGYGLFGAGALMASMPAGFTLFLALSALSMAVYILFVKTGRAKEIISEVDQRLKDL